MIKQLQEIVFCVGFLMSSVGVWMLSPAWCLILSGLVLLVGAIHGIRKND